MKPTRPRRTAVASFATCVDAPEQHRHRATSRIFDGGGIFGLNVTLQNSTFASNIADNDNSARSRRRPGRRHRTRLTKFKMTNSIIVGNSDTAERQPRPARFQLAATSVRFSLIGDNTGLPQRRPVHDHRSWRCKTPTGILSATPRRSCRFRRSTLVLDGRPRWPTMAARRPPSRSTPAASPSTRATTAFVAEPRPTATSAVCRSLASRPSAALSTWAHSKLQTATVGNTAPVVANAIADKSATVGNFFSLHLPAQHVHRCRWRRAHLLGNAQWRRRAARLAHV